MTLFLGTWKVMDEKRVPCMTYFGSMTKEDDEKESSGVELLGRWSNMCNATGACIFRAKNYKDAASWLYNWVPMATCNVKPICDDNSARRVILKREPDYLVDYSHVNDEPEEGETLYLINYKFNKESRLKGNETFAKLTKEQDEGDSGNCRPLGRWHDLGNGSGVAVAAAKNEEDLYSWAFNWASMCECTVEPVLTDTQAREVVRSKPNYEELLKSLSNSS